MALTDELVEIMNGCPDEATRKALAGAVRKLRKDATPKTRVVNPNRVTTAAHDAAVKAGAKARAEGRSCHMLAGSLQERSAWLAGWNDEDLRRGGK